LRIITTRFLDLTQFFYVFPSCNVILTNSIGFLDSKTIRNNVYFTFLEHNKNRLFHSSFLDARQYTCWNTSSIISRTSDQWTTKRFKHYRNEKNHLTLHGQTSVAISQLLNDLFAHLVAQGPIAEINSKDFSNVHIN